MAESSLWQYLKKGMQGRWEHVRRHEDMAGTGVSDVSYYLNGNGWIELKEIKRLPIRETTGISLGQWHENGGAQRHWLIMRKGWLLVRLNKPRHYLLFGHHALPPWQKDQRWTWAEMRANAYYIWIGRIDFVTLQSILEKHG